MRESPLPHRTCDGVTGTRGRGAERHPTSPAVGPRTVSGRHGTIVPLPSLAMTLWRPGHRGAAAQSRAGCVVACFRLGAMIRHMMARVMRHTGIVLLLSTVATHVGAAACLLDCNPLVSPPANHQGASCHEAASIDGAAVQFSALRTACHEDHAALTTELVLEIRGPQADPAAVAAIDSRSSLPLPTSATLLRTSPHPRPPVAAGAILPLRL
jgi:hypothetical protein